MDELESIWYNGRGGRYHHYDDTRYHGLNLHSVFSKGTIEFRLFNSTLHAGRVKTYIQLCLAISNQALHQKGASRSKTQSPNEKYTFRTWLLRLGMIGDEFKTARTFLLEKLEGNIAWRDPAQAEAQKERFAARRLAELEDHTTPEPEEPSDIVQDEDTDQDEEPAFRISM
ncbi:MAG: amidoligase family protein [Clostridia bacterium]|nr:amidoligase family protein [Clostridia bacterium]